MLEYRSKGEVYIYTDESSVITKGSDFSIVRPTVVEVGGAGVERRFISNDQVAVVRIVSVYGTVGKGKVVESSGEIMAGDYAVELQGYTTTGEAIAAIIGIAGLIVLLLLASMFEQ